MEASRDKNAVYLIVIVVAVVGVIAALVQDLPGAAELVAVLFAVLVILRIIQRFKAKAAGRSRTTKIAHPQAGPSPWDLESLLNRDTVADEINYMSGPEFERFMADFLRRQGYAVEETPLSGDQGVDLVLPDFDGRRVVVQLKRYTRPVGNGAVQATFAGMAHYRAAEGWIITTSTFTKSARELARSTRVRLIDGKELAEWLEDGRNQE